MSSRYVTHGLLLVAIGVFFLLSNLGIDLRIPWANLWQLWPVFLVILGLQMLFPRGVMAVLAPLLLVATVLLAFWGFPPLLGVAQYREATVPLPPTVEQAELRLDGLPVARLDVTAAEQLAPDIAVHSVMDGRLAARWAARHNGTSVFTLTPRSSGLGVFQGYSTPLQLRLASGVVWDFFLDVAVATGEIDLSSIPWGSLTVNSGVSNLTLRVGTVEQMAEVLVHSGVGVVTIEAPHAVPVRIRTDTPSFLHNVGTLGLQQTGNTYHTPGFAEAPTGIDITIHSGVTRVRLRRY